MIQNFLVFCIKGDLSFVDGSLPIGKLTANDINRNSIYVVSPLTIDNVVKVSFADKMQVWKRETVLATNVNDKISVSELVEKNKSYYELVKDWNVWEVKVPQKVLGFISNHRTSEVGISFNFSKLETPQAPDVNFVANITSESYTMVSNGYYVVKVNNYSYGQDKVANLNDILVKNGNEITIKKAISFSGNTPTVLYKVDPSILSDNFDVIEPTLTDQIIGQLNELQYDVSILEQEIESAVSMEWLENNTATINGETLLENKDFSLAIKTIDQKLEELGNRSLREIFENNNEIVNPELSTTNGWGEVVSVSGGVGTVVNVSGFNNGFATQGRTFVPTNKYYARARIRTLGTDTVLLSIRAHGRTVADLNNPVRNKWYDLSGTWNGNEADTSIRFRGQTASVTAQSYEFTKPLVLNLTSLGIDTLTKQDLDFYYKQYITLKEKNEIGLFNTKAIRAIDQEVSELNNRSLKEFFEDYNVVVNADFNGTTGWQGNYSTLSAENNVLTAVSNGQAYGGIYQNAALTIGNTYYVNVEITSDYNHRTFTILNGNINVPNFVVNKKTQISRIATATNTALELYQYVNAETATILYKKPTVINLTMLGLTNLTTRELDFYFNQYSILKEKQEVGLLINKVNKMIDQRISALGNRSLRELFENNNLLSDDISKWTTISGTLSFDSNNRNLIFKATDQFGMAVFNTQTNLSGKVIFEFFETTARTNNFFGITSNETYITKNGPQIFSNKRTISGDSTNYTIGDNSSSGWENVLFKNCLLLDLTQLGLTNLSQTDLDFYYNQYLILKEQGEVGLILSKASRVQEEWITPTLLNGTTNFASDGIKYMKDSLGFVHITGRVTTPSTATTIIFNLPVGYRPKTTKAFIAVGPSGPLTMLVGLDGNITIYGPSTSWNSINIDFMEGA